MSPTTAHLLLVLWLAPCALYDLRRRRIPNWLTLPALPLALVWAWGHGAFVLALTVLAASLLAFHFGGLGGADGKLATVQAAVAPPALLASGLLLFATFLALRLRGVREVHLPAGVWFWLGAIVAFFPSPL